MNTILISNPFLFPPSGDNEEAKQLLQTRKEIVKNYITYQVNEFEKAWKTAGEESIRKTNDLWDNIFPEKESDQSTFCQAMDHVWDMEALLGMQYEESDLAFSPIYNHSQSEKEGKEDFDLLTKTTETLQEMQESTMYGLAEGDQKGANPHSLEGAQEQPSSQESLSDNYFNDANFDLLSFINNPAQTSTSNTTLNMDDITSIGIQNPTEVKPQSTFAVKTEPNSVEPALVHAQIKQRPRRKSAQTSRNIQDNSVMFPEEHSINLLVPPTNNTASVTEMKKPLANLNGGRVLSLSLTVPSTSTSNVIKTEPQSPHPTKGKSGKSAESRRKRKYEEEDDNDPSVKNAKAAKLNRDKKKQQLNTLQAQVNQLQSENSALHVKMAENETKFTAIIQDRDSTISDLTRQLNEERSKNSASALQKVTMLDYIQKYINATAGLNQGQAPVVHLSQRLADMPMPAPGEVQRLLLMAPGQSTLSQGMQNLNS